MTLSAQQQTLTPARPIQEPSLASVRAKLHRPGESDEVKARNLAQLPNRPEIIWSDRTDLGLYLPEGYQERIAELRKTVPKPLPPLPARPKPPRPSAIFRAIGVSETVRDRLDSAYPAFANAQDFNTRSIEPVRTFKTGAGALADLQIGPGRVTLIGGPPKRGKTNLACQLAIDAVRSETGLMAFISNAEMPASTLMARQVSRLSGVPLERLGESGLPEDIAKRIRDAETTLRKIGCVDPEIEDDIGDLSEGRYETAVQFCSPPFSTLNLMCLAAEAEHYAMRRPDQIIVVCDYVQRFSALDRNLFEKWKRYCERKRVSIQPPHVHDVDAVMSELRALAQTGVCVIAVSAMSRDSYDKATLGGFRGSSELEYAADDAYVLTHDEDRKGIVHLRHVASRNSATRDRVLRFQGEFHRFTPVE